MSHNDSEKQNDVQTQAQAEKPLWPLVTGATLLGLIAGAFMIYTNISGDDTVLASGALNAENACTLSDSQRTMLSNAAQGDVQNMLPSDPPKPLQDLAFKLPDDTLTSIGAMRDKILLVNLWATWCAPCREEMPALDNLQGLLGNDDFEVVTISVDTTGKEKPLGFLQEIGVKNLTFYRDETMGVFNRFRRDGLALGLPSTVLIGRDGCVLAGMNGPAVWDGEDAQNYVKAALADETL